MRFTNFYVGGAVCTPSRASLLTGCYPKRVGLQSGVLFPNDKKGLHPDEIIIAVLLKTRGYATACIGKWHLGRPSELLPTSQGFDCYFGVPYSNDMLPEHVMAQAMGGFPDLPLMKNNENLYEEKPEIVEKLRAAATAFDAELVAHSRPVDQVD